MYCAIIRGWTEIMAFGTTEEKARELALKEKKRRCSDEGIDKWTWERVEEYFGAYSFEVKDGYVEEV